MQASDDGADGDRLDQIATQWSLLRRAHQPDPLAAGAARNALVLRYNRAIRRYIGALLRDDHAADEVANDVMVRMLRGDFARATPGRGRFRDLLKVAVKNMVRNYWDREQRRSGVDIDVVSMADPRGGDEAAVDAAWDTAWRAGVLDMAWQSLAGYQQQTAGSIAYTLLRLRADHPDDDIAALARRLEETTGRSLAAAAVRQQLRRARLRFAELLLDELAGALSDPTPERLEEELADLDLMKYVRDFLPDDWRVRGQLRE